MSPYKYVYNYMNVKTANCLSFSVSNVRTFFGASRKNEKT